MRVTNLFPRQTGKYRRVDSGWVRLGRAIRHDRMRFWRTREEFSRGSGISARVIDDLESGRRGNYSEATLAAVEVALGWREGTCRRVVSGGRVFREVDPAMARIMLVWPRLSTDAKSMLADLAERSVT